MSETQSLPAPQVAAKLNDEGKFAEALALVAPMVEKSEKRPNAYIQMSRALRGLKDLKAARDVEEQALATFTNDVWVHVHVGTVLINEKQFGKAATVLAPSVKAGRTEPQLLNACSIALRGEKRDSEAEAIELRAVELHPAHPGVLARRATVLNEARRFGEVLELFKGKEAVLKASPWLSKLIETAQKATEEQPKAATASVLPSAPARPAPAAPSSSVPSTAAASPSAPARAPAVGASVSSSTPARPAPAAPSSSVPSTAAASPSATSARTTPAVPSNDTDAAATRARFSEVPSGISPARAAPTSSPAAPKSSTVAPQEAEPRSAPRPTTAAGATATAIAAAATANPLNQPAATRADVSSAWANASQAAPSYAPPPSRTSGFTIFLLSVLGVALGLAIAHLSGVIDLTPMLREISSMVEAARK